MYDFLKKTNAKIANGKLLVKKNGEYSPIDYRNYHSYGSYHLRINRRIHDVSLLNKYLDGEPLSDHHIANANKLLCVAQAESETELKYGTWVKFKNPYDSLRVIEGFIESPFCGRIGDPVDTNIERKQFSGLNSWGNYIIKGIPLQEIKANLIEHEPALLPPEMLFSKLLITKKDFKEQIAYRFNTTPDKVSNVVVDDEDECVTADIADISKFCNCGWLEEYATTLEGYKEKIH